MRKKIELLKYEPEVQAFFPEVVVSVFRVDRAVVQYFAVYGNASAVCGVQKVQTS